MLCVCVCVQANVLQVYEAVEKVALHYYSTEDQFIISCPSQDQVRFRPQRTQGCMCMYMYM